MCRSVKRAASGALGLCHVANGRTDAYAERHINAWDVAAGMVIAGEAGALEHRTEELVASCRLSAARVAPSPSKVAVLPGVW